MRGYYVCTQCYDCVACVRDKIHYDDRQHALVVEHARYATFHKGYKVHREEQRGFLSK